MTTASEAKRTALVLVLDELGAIDAHFERRMKATAWEFESKPSHQQGDVVLLGAYGPKGSGGLYVFVGMLTGCRLVEKTLVYERVTRFWVPVIASYGEHLRREDLLGDREDWGPHEFNYVLPAAIVKVPAEAEALAKAMRLAHPPVAMIPAPPL
jgi:hypothetical protein